MTTVAEVILWGKTIGAVSIQEGAQIAHFQYDPVFAESGIELAPLEMPLSHKVFSFPELVPASFRGLPGMLADSLPDRFGNALINAWLATQGRLPQSFNAVERLCYVGNRGMGALEFKPAIGPREVKSKQIQIDQLVALASEILSQRQDFRTSFATPKKERALREILRVGTSVGGARAKAVIAWHPKTNKVRSGQVPTDEGFEYWIIKFDGVTGNKDKELEDPLGYGAIEYAYYLMACDAGIEMQPCRLLEENGRRHFMTQRFDRLNGGKKLHMQSLAALCHFDFNMAGAYGYEQAMTAMRRLGLPMQAFEQQYRRMVFNIIARNQDDHVKNIAFLMDKSGSWSLSPAFDVTYSYNPEGKWTNSHQMTLNGKRDNFNFQDFDACARLVSMKRGRAKTIFENVRQTVSQWPRYAETAGVEPEWNKRIQRSLRLDIR